MKKPDIYFRFVSADRLQRDELQPSDTKRVDIIYRVCSYPIRCATIEASMLDASLNIRRRGYELSDAYMEHKGRKKVWIYEFREVQ
jgi:hypothetical protein